MIRFLLAALLALAAPAAWCDARAFFLVARHDLPDPNFEDTVVLMVRDGPSGPLGVVVNRPTMVPLSHYFPDVAKLAKSNLKVFFGGPVARNTLTFLVRADAPPDEDAIEVAKGLYLRADGDALRKALRGDNPEGLRVFAGFAAWAPGQLEAEIGRGDWHTLAADPKSILERKPEGLWRELEREASATKIRWDFSRDPAALPPAWRRDARPRRRGARRAGIPRRRC